MQQDDDELMFLYSLTLCSGGSRTGRYLSLIRIHGEIWYVCMYVCMYLDPGPDDAGGIGALVSFDLIIQSGLV